MMNASELRELVERSGMSYADIARALGWYCHGAVDSFRLKRRLGVATYWCPYRKEFVRTQKVWPRTALKIIEAIGLDPVDVGL